MNGENYTRIFLSQAVDIKWHKMGTLEAAVLCFAFRNQGGFPGAGLLGGLVL